MDEYISTLFLNHPFGSCAVDAGFEVADAMPVVAGVQIDFGNDDFAPLFGLLDHFAFVIVDGGLGPVLVVVGVAAANEPDVKRGRISSRGAQLTQADLCGAAARETLTVSSKASSGFMMCPIVVLGSPLSKIGNRGTANVG